MTTVVACGDARVVVACGGARVSARKDAIVVRLSPPRSNLALSVAGLSRDLAARIPPAFVDLVEIAAYVEAADLAAHAPDRRVGGARRRFHVVVPVREPAVFQDPAVFVPLERTLSALSGDDWRIEAQPRRAKTDAGAAAWIDGEPAASAARGAIDAREPRDQRAREPRDVVPFSGGLDSFAGALRLVREGRRVLLVAQRSAPKIEPHVARLARALVDLGEGRVAFLPVFVRNDLRVRDGAPSTRGALWTALAGALAAAHGRGSGVRFFENGVVALGLPLSAAAIVAPAARPTDPRVLAGFQRLLSAVARRATPVDNGFVFATKADVVRGIERDEGAGWIATTVSCTRRAPRPHTHCGLCAQCIDRRFATLAAGARAHDPEGLYAVDLLTGARPAGAPRAIVEAYLRAATAVAGATDAEVFARHGELARVLPYLPGSVDDAASALIELQRRHAAEVEEVLDAGIREHATSLRRGAVPPSALLRLALPDARPEEPHADVRAARPPAPPGVVRVLHVSDLHFSRRRAWDQDPVLRALADDVSRLRASGLAPDLVAVTGDVADRGAPEEYALAARFFRERLLPAAGVDPDRLLMVPGNHDVDRGAVKRVAQATQSDLLRAESQDAIAAIVSDAAEHAPLLRRHDAWRAFVRDLGVPRSDDHPWWSRTFTLGALRVHVAGLCSSWVSWCDEDKGRLLVGRAQLHETLDGADRADLSLALIHHPWDYLADFDAAEAREAIHRRCHVLLRGHLHKGEGASRVRPDGGSLELAAGASWGGTQHLHGYQLVELEPQKAEARVHLRTWDGHDWIADRNAYRGAAASGVAVFTLRA